MPTFPIQVRTMVVRNGSNIHIYYPQVFHLHNRVLERFINQWIVRETQALINQQIAEMPTTVVEMIGTFEIKSNQRDVFSLTLSNYTYHDKAAHGMTYMKSLTFDLETGEKSSLSSLFKPNSNYVQRLSSLIKEQIEERDIPVIADFNEISTNQDFYLADRTLVLYFQLYELAPYSFGFPIFPISVYDIQDIIREDGPLGRLAEHN